MYRRTYYEPSDNSRRLPENYSGLAFDPKEEFPPPPSESEEREKTEPKAPSLPPESPSDTPVSAAAQPPPRESGKNPWEIPPRPATPPSPPPKSGDLFFPIGKLLSSLPGKLRLRESGTTGIPLLEKIKLPHIGQEEILILGVALILLFSKERDPLCALMLVALLWIN